MSQSQIQASFGGRGRSDEAEKVIDIVLAMAKVPCLILVRTGHMYKDNERMKTRIHLLHYM